MKINAEFRRVRIHNYFDFVFSIDFYTVNLIIHLHLTKALYMRYIQKFMCGYCIHTGEYIQLIYPLQFWS